MKNQALDLEQVASLCGVSLNRVRRWIDKRELKVETADGASQKVRAADMIDFLVKHNFPIPESIVPFKAKKILFLCAGESDSREFLRFLINFLGQLRKMGNSFITDHISFGPDAKMKVMVFRPDAIILDMTENDDDAVAMSMIIKGMEEFSATKLVAVTGSKTLDCNKTLAVECGIDEVAPVCADAGVLAKRLLDIS